MDTASLPKSKGHICFHLGYEYMKLRGKVYRAKEDCPMVRGVRGDGYGLRFECLARDWPLRCRSIGVAIEYWDLN
jgi:hypothetical protein